MHVERQIPILAAVPKASQNSAKFTQHRSNLFAQRHACGGSVEPLHPVWDGSNRQGGGITPRRGRPGKREACGASARLSREGVVCLFRCTRMWKSSFPPCKGGRTTPTHSVRRPHASSEPPFRLAQLLTVAMTHCRLPRTAPVSRSARIRGKHSSRSAALGHPVCSSWLLPPSQWV